MVRKTKRVSKAKAANDAATAKAEVETAAKKVKDLADKAAKAAAD